MERNMRYNQSMAQILSEMQAQEGRMKDLSMKVNKVIAKMKKDRQMKGFADKFKRDVMRSMDIEKSLEKVLPDYIAGKEIQKLVKEQEGEQEDPIDQAKKKIDKIKKLAVLKKQMQDIQKSEDLDKKDEPTVKKVVKMLKKASDAHAGQAKDLEKDLKDDVNEVTVTIKSYDTKTGLDRQAEKQLNKVATRAGAKVKKSGNNVYKLTGNGKQISKFMANIDQIDGSFMTEDNEFIIEFTSSQIARLKKEYEPLRGKETGINPEKFKKLRGMMQRFPKANLLKLAKENIPVLTTGAKAALVLYHGMKYKQLPEELVPYIDIFADDTLDEQKGKFKSIDPKVLARISNMMRGSKEEKQSLANMLNYFMPPEVVDMVRDKFGIRMPRGKIKFTDL